MTEILLRVSQFFFSFFWILKYNKNIFCYKNVNVWRTTVNINDFSFKIFQFFFKKKWKHKNIDRVESSSLYLSNLQKWWKWKGKRNLHNFCKSLITETIITHRIYDSCTHDEFLIIVVFTFFANLIDFCLCLFVTFSYIYGNFMFSWDFF